MLRLLVQLVVALSAFTCAESSKLAVLDGSCFEYTRKGEWWTYRWCYQHRVGQMHINRHTKRIEQEHDLGGFTSLVSLPDGKVTQIYRSDDAACETNGEVIPRRADVNIYCCTIDESARGRQKRDIKHGTFIESVREVVDCHYEINVCTVHLCTQAHIDTASTASRVPSPPMPPTARNKANVHESIAKRIAASHAHVSPPPPAPQTPQRPARAHTKHMPIDEDLQKELLQRVRNMFYHGYDSYMKYAFPSGDLLPLSCKGGHFDLIKIPLVTLIDSLDMLVVMGNHSEFRRAVSLLQYHLPNFNLDVNVSVFETNIRILGGLVSAHLMAIDPKLNIYTGGTEEYNNFLLYLATDLGDRLLPAFKTQTGIPYGTVNLRHGVPKGETPIASTAGAGSLVIEFEALSRLTGDPKYGDAAIRAVEQLHARRSDIGLLGKHIHIGTGKWQETLSGIGSNSDSYYEYLLKAYFMFGDAKFYEMFMFTYIAVWKHSLSSGKNTWFADVDMFTGKLRKNRVESLHAFWAGMDVSMGYLVESSSFLNALYSIWNDFHFLPEEFDPANWKTGKANSNALYPLRPELIESTYLHYRASGDRSWLQAGMTFLESIEKYSRTECGYASIKNINDKELEDSMPSFFLSETCKYLYLLFDEDNFIHSRDYIFSTEAHPIDVMQLPAISRPDIEEAANDDYSKLMTTLAQLLPDISEEASNMSRASLDDFIERLQYGHSGTCPVRPWWTIPSYDPNYAVTARIHPSPSGMNEEHEICTFDDEPLSAPQDSAGRVVTIDVENVGEFIVQIFADGFIITSVKYGNALEISGVGMQKIFVIERNETNTMSRASNGKMMTSHCRVRLHAPAVEQKSKYWIWSDEPTNVAFTERTCAYAAFGISKQIADADIISTLRVRGEPLRPSDTEGCTSMMQEGRNWLGWMTPSQPEQKSTSTVVIVDRGNCMFEEKVQLAEKFGATGAIVVNTEETVFMMAGKQATWATAEDPSKEDTHIPAVMLSKKDGALLLSSIETLKNQGRAPTVEIELDSEPAFFDNDIMGNDQYPKIIASPHLIHVLTSGEWSAMLTSSHSNEWQLFVSEKSATFKITTQLWHVKLPSGQGITTNALGTFNSAEMYRLYISQQCPSYFRVQNNMILIDDKY